MNMNSSHLHAVYSSHRIELYRKEDNRPILVQHAEPNKRPYIHPIAAPDGAGVLTENAPAHHPWQHGLYTGLNEVNGVGFWEEGLRNNPKDGTFHPRSLKSPIVKGLNAQWEVETEWCSPDDFPMLEEVQSWTFTDLGNAYVLDLEWTLRAYTDITFGRYDYGGLFIRMPYRQELGGNALSSEGLTKEEMDGKRARWAAVSMPIPGRDTAAGAALMDHPSNPEHPVPWRVDRQLGVSPSPCIAGAWQLQAGASQLFKHRVYLFTGEINAAEIEEMWKEFSAKEDESE